MKISTLTTEQLRAGIRRCQARSDGIMPFTVITRQQNEDALREYKNELNRRNEADLFNE